MHFSGWRPGGQFEKARSDKPLFLLGSSFGYAEVKGIFTFLADAHKMTSDLCPPMLRDKKGTEEKEGRAESQGCDGELKE